MNKLRLNYKVKHLQNNHMVTSRAITPNDDYYAQQWAPSKIHLPDVWDEYTTGGTSADGDDIVIAVIDGGFDLAHEDLNYWKNTNEIPGNGIDDDNNGYIDDYDGWNAYSGTGNIPNDSHGTHVAGIAGAIGNNDTGISGVNWNVGILPIAGRSTTEATVVAAYSYVLEMRSLYNETNGQLGAFIVVTNASFGVDQGDPDDFPIWCSIYDQLGNEGILNCAATANANWNIDQVGDVPTACSSEFLVSVTNTDVNDNKYADAAYGITSIDIGAPGTNIYSTLPGDNYGNLTGTSMATPQVAGVIALMYASMCQNMIQNSKNNPRDFALMVRQYLLEGADNISSLNGLVAHGRLNALEAIERSLGTSPSIVISGPSLVCSSGATFTLNILPPVNFIEWTCGPSLKISSGQNTASCTFSVTGSGSSWVSAMLVTDCGNITLPTKTVWVGAPVITGISGPTTTPNNMWASYHAVLGSNSAPTDYNWILSPLNGNYVYDYGNMVTLSFYNWGYYRLQVQAKNVCTGAGYGPIYETSIYVYNALGLAITPNPATGEATIRLVGESKEAPVAFTEWDYEIYDSMQSMKEKKSKLKTVETKINTAGWKEGVYIVRAKVGDKILSEKLVVKH